MAKQEFNNASAADLRAQLGEAHKKLGQLRFDLADKKLKKTSDIGATRRTIARILTALKNAK